MKKSAIVSFLALLTAAPASAHMVWIERPAPEAVQVYFGEPGEREKTGGVLDRLVPTLFAGNDHALPLERKPDHIAAQVKTGMGDVRLVDDRYPPFGEGARGVMRPIMYARHGRSETRAGMDFELVPVEPNGSRFTLVLDGKPLARHKVTAIAPDGTESQLETDAAGIATLGSTAPGRHILKASMIDRTPGSFGGKPFDMTARVTTLAFTQK
jgi:hypothetical protein